MDAAGLDASVRRLVLDRLRTWHGIDPDRVAHDRPLAEIGVTSRDAVALAAEISELTGAALPATLLWEAPTLDALARLARECALGRAAQNGSVAPSGADPSGPRGDDVAIAVIGVGCRLPGGVNSPADFRRLLNDGIDAISTLPDGRWQGFAAPNDPAVAQTSRYGGFLHDIAGFDAGFFGIAPSEAVAMDPQQRLLLEVACESLDHAAIPACALPGSRTGVFVGICGNEYSRLTMSALDDVEAWTVPGSALSIAANRLSYALDLRGPSVAVDTACSSSLVAVHQAVRALAAGECDTALAGGVNVLLSPNLTLSFQRAGALAADGRCKTFDAAADGMVRAEGCALVVLRRLADAEAAGDRVLAVIRASAVNSDGRSNGLLAPNAEAQRALLADIYGPSGVVGAAEVDYVEAHGTGTELGDPVEAGALGAVLGRGRGADQPLLIGSVKTNVGHLEAAAGVTGLVKTVLALHQGVVPPQLHFTTPSPHIDFESLGLRVVTETEPWPRYSGTATAGVSAFGFGGTNAHVVLQEYRQKADKPTGTSAGPVLLALDAPTPERLREDAADLAAWLRDGERAPKAADVAHTLLGRLGKGRHRASVVARTGEQAADALAKLAIGEPHPAVVPGLVRSGGPRAVWVFSGYGSQWPGMARRLLDDEPAFAAAVDRIEPVLRREAGLSLRAQLEPDATLARPSNVQPALFGLQVALAELWRAHGLQPAAVIGHSMGEVAAAVVSGALDIAEGARIVTVRSRLLAELSGGAMAVVDRSPEAIEQLGRELPSLRVAVYSSPEQCVVAGASEDVERLVARVADQGGTARLLRVAAAGHTAQVDPLLEPFVAQLGTIEPRPPACRMYTTVERNQHSEPVLDTTYWARNLREPVRFRQAVAAAARDGHRIFVEVSPHPTQLHPLSETLSAAGIDDALIVPTLRRDTDDAVTFRLALGTLLANGAVDPLVARRSLHPRARVIGMPSPRWRHQRFWANGAAVATASAPPTLVRTPDTTRPVTTQDRLRACVAEVMGYAPETIDADTPLTELGLDSLQAARIRTVVKRDFGFEVPPGALLRNGTIAHVAALLDESSEQRAAPGAPRPATVQQASGRRGVLPRDAAERLVAQTWQSVSGAAAADVCDPLGSLTQNPYLTEELARAVGEVLGKPVRLPTPTGLVTIADIADDVRPLLEEPTDGPVRVLRAEGGRAPLFLIHPAGGSTAVYRALVNRLGSDRPCYGLERLPNLPEVRERAAKYARLIRELRPAGPWSLGGWSYGGVVAQETARLLAPHGSVSALILIDSVLPLPGPDLTREQLARDRFAAFAAYVEEVYGSPLILPYDELAMLDDAMQIDLVIKTLQQVVDLPPAIVEHQRDSYLDLRSGERHALGAYPGRTLLYRATEPAPHTVRDTRYERNDATLGWDEFCPDLTVRPVTGHHLSLLDPPVVDVLGGLLSEDLDV